VSFIREYSIVCNGVNISSFGKLTPLKVSFSCNYSITSQQDRFTVSIWNLGAGTRKVLENEGADIEIYAGYRDGIFGLIAKGEVRTVWSQRDNVDIVTIISAGSGDKACQKGKCNKTLSKGCTVEQVIQEVASGMENISIGQLKGVGHREDKTHKTITGSARNVLNKLAKKNGFDWFIYLQKLYALRKDLMFGDTFVANVYSGMIGSPRINEKGATVDMLLNPNVLMGGVLQVQSKDLSRSYKIVGISHQADFLGGSASWKTTITGTSPDKLSVCGSQN
jgi:hypothetical protein